MLLKINQHHWLRHPLWLLFFFGCLGVIILALELEFTGALVTLSFFAILVYSCIFFLLRKIKVLANRPLFRGKAKWVMMALLGLLTISGVIDAFFQQSGGAIVLIVLFFAVLVFAYANFKHEYLQEHGLLRIDRPGIVQFSLWAIGTTATVTLLAAIFHENDLLVGLLGPVYFLVLLGLGIRWLVKQTQLIINLKNEQAKTELMHLKSQVNPHFFFNTLNNLYGLVAIDPEKAQALILKLSDLMRYSIYQGQEDLVSLEQEVAYLQNYIELHRMRYHKNIDVIFTLNIEQKGYQVMPLLFIILLENAFKHGVENLREQAYVKIALTASAQEIAFSLENNFDPLQLPAQAGIGLENLKRRLELMYPQQHDLSFRTHDEVYYAALRLPQL